MANKREKVPDVTEQKSSKIAFHAILASSDLPGQALSQTRLKYKLESLGEASYETTAGSLAIGTFHCIHGPDVYRWLKIELVKSMLDPDTILLWTDLQSLPYLIAVIKDSLPVALGPAERIPRINSNSTWTHKYWNISPGTIVGIGQYHMHTNDLGFDEPHAFRPERIPYAHRYRSNIAYAEIYIAIATVFRHDLKLSAIATNPRDVEFNTEDLGMSPWPGSKGVVALEKK